MLQRNPSKPNRPHFHHQNGDTRQFVRPARFHLVQNVLLCVKTADFEAEFKQIFGCSLSAKKITQNNIQYQMEIGTKTAKNQLKACSVIGRLKIDRPSTYLQCLFKVKMSRYINHLILEITVTVFVNHNKKHAVYKLRHLKQTFLEKR